MLTKKDLIFLTARIESHDKVPIGSGVLWAPSKNSGVVYVFTAKHVVEDALEFKKSLFVRFINKDESEEVIEATIDNIATHHNRDIEAAVLKCNYTINDSVLFYAVENNKRTNEEIEVSLHGFPVNGYNPAFVISMNALSGNLLAYDEDCKKIKYRITAPLDTTKRNEELEGFSGGGVYSFKDNSYRLIGIHSQEYGYNAHINQVICTSIECFLEICKDRNWHVPEYLSEANGYLLDVWDKCKDEILEYFESLEDMNVIANSDNSQLMQSGFCGYSKECECTDAFHRCNYFRESLLLALTLLKGIGSDITQESIMYGTIPVYYICSEGMDTGRRLKIGDFVKSIKLDYNQRKAIQDEKKNIRDDSFIIWNSRNKTTSPLICEKFEYKNIIGDITKQMMLEGFNIKNGLPSPKNLSIIHIDELVEQFHNNNGNTNNFKTWIDTKIS